MNAHHSGVTPQAAKNNAQYDDFYSVLSTNKGRQGREFVSTIESKKYPVYGTQFHAELLPNQLVERLSTFRQYMPDDDQFEQLKASMRPTPDAGRLLSRFFEQVLGSRSEPH